MSGEESNKYILVLDDSRTIRSSLKKILREHFTVTEAEDGEDGWTKLLLNPDISLVITDIMMPNLDGYGFICRIRGNESDYYKKLPIIVVTGAEDDITRERSHACGANNFIVKPVESFDLIERVNFHTEVKLSGELVDGAQMAKFGVNIESAEIAAPDLTTALNLLSSGDTGAIKPYANDLAIQVIPLLEYCNTTLQLELDSEIATFKEKMQAM